MKLSKDKGLVHYMKVKYDTILCFDILFEDIDKYLEEHGFHIYPVKKEKVIESIDKFSLGDVVFVTDENHDQFGNYGDVIALVSGAVKVDFGKGVTRIIPNDFLEFYEKVKEPEITDHFREILKRAADEIEGAWRESQKDKVPCEPEPKPSADGEESLTENTFRLNLDGIDQVVKRELSKALPSITFTYWQKCPVCNGSGKEKAPPFPYTDDIGKIFAYLSMGNKGQKDCPCCNGDMVIPMKRESR